MQTFCGEVVVVNFLPPLLQFLWSNIIISYVLIVISASIDNRYFPGDWRSLFPQRSVIIISLFRGSTIKFARLRASLLCPVRQSIHYLVRRVSKHTNLHYASHYMGIHSIRSCGQGFKGNQIVPVSLKNSGTKSYS